MKTYNTENPIWYAVMADHEDTDWGYGSSSYAKAVTMCKDMREDGHPDAFIAVIDDGNDPTCIDEITDLDNEKGDKIWQTACDEGMTDRDPDGYEVVDNETIALAKLSETPFTQVSKFFTVNGHEVEVTSCLYLYKDDPVQEGVLVHDMTDEYHDGDAIYGDGNVIENIKEASDLEDILNYGAPETSFEKLADGLYKIL